jgi:hypothetical protein
VINFFNLIQKQEILGQLNNYQLFKILHHGIGNITEEKVFPIQAVTCWQHQIDTIMSCI